VQERERSDEVGLLVTPIKACEEEKVTPDEMKKKRFCPLAMSKNLNYIRQDEILKWEMKRLRE
jgi:hypothetical protein